MNAKIFAVISVLLLVAVGWFFINQQDSEPKPTLAPPKVSSEVTDIKAIQTNPETGEIEYELTAKSLTQNQAGQDVMNDVVMKWQATAQDRYTITAKTAQLDQNTGDMTFGEGFEFIRHATGDAESMTLTGSTLLGNTKSKRIESKTALKVTQAESFFEARAMQGDLNTGEYEFFGITKNFLPPARQDRALF